MNQQLSLGESGSLVALEKAWETTLKLLEAEINRPSFESFFKTAKPLSLDGTAAIIGASSELAKIFLDKYADMIKAALESAVGCQLQLSFCIAPKSEQHKSRPSEAKEPTRPKRNLSAFSLQLNEKYNFSSFVVGHCNRLAHAAAKSAAERPGQVYNPFFLYGGSGLGKTHLLQAVGQLVLENHPELQVAYVSGEVFTSQYVNAIIAKKSEDFRHKYRSIDVWLIDDVQFLARGEHTKEEFFHTFNSLYQLNKQIFLSSDCSPAELIRFDERLRSRFESGLVVDIAPPDLETRIAILQNKAIRENMQVDYKVLEFIANLIPTSIRALEGALITLLAYSSLMKVPLSEELAADVLHRHIMEKKCSELTPEAVVRAVAIAFSVSVEDIKGDKRLKDLVLARHVAMHLCREATKASLAAIGQALGGRDHATVVHACSRIKTLMKDDPQLKDKIESLQESLKNGRF